MEVKYKYEFIIDGEVVDRFFAKTRKELKEIIDITEEKEDKFLEELAKR